MLFRRISISIGITLWVAAVTAQTGNFQFSRLDIGQGLSNNQINCIFKDRTGFLWFGTMSGLNRYDGYRFRVFRHIMQDSTSIADDYISNIFEGPSGKLWIITRSGLNIYDPLTESFDRNTNKELEHLQLPPDEINSILKDLSGNYWFLMGKRRLYKYEPGKGPPRLMREALPGNAMTAFNTDHNGDGWIIYSNGLIEMIHPNTAQVLSSSRALIQAARGNSVGFSCFIDSDNELWIYSSADARGVFHFIPQSGRLEHLTKERGWPRLNTDVVMSVLQDNKGSIWICTDHGGVNVLDKKSGRIETLLNNVDDDKSLSQNSITAAYKDDAGIIWLGTFKKGISYYHENIIKFPLFRHLPSDPNSLSYDDVNRFVEDRKGNIWIGTNGGGLIYFDRQQNRFTQYRHDPSNTNSISNDVIVSLCIDHNQDLWIGSYYGGLDRFNGRNFVHYRHSEKDSNSLADDRVWEIFEDSRQQLWVGTLGSGLDLFDRDKNVFHHYRVSDGHSLYSDYISTLMEDKAGNLWVGTAYGIDVLERASGIFVHYGNDPADSGSLSNDNVLSMLEDSHGLLIWVGTRDGLNVYNKVTKKFQHFRKEDGLPSNAILNILEDGRHHIWVSTPNGISQLIPDINYDSGRVRLAARNYDELDGLQGTEFNENAALKTSLGELIFGGANGFNLFQPEGIVSSNSNPPLVLTDLQIFNRSVGIGEKIDGRIPLSKSISQTRSITLRHNEDVLAFEFAALGYSKPERVRYAYKLEGFNKEWLVTDGSMRKATYTNLDPGDYHFLVKSAREDGSWNEPGLILAVTILPPFWQTPLAYIIYFLLGAGLLWGARQIVVQRARLRFEMEQQKKEARRMHELDMLKIRFFTNVSHEFRTPLSLIISPLEKLMEEKNDPDEQKHLNLIHRNARRLLNLVNQLLDFRRMEVQELRLNAQPGDIIAFVTEVVQSFHDMAENKGISFSYEAPVEERRVLFDKEKLERILFNLLSNAFKFTPEKGQITVIVQLQEGDPAIFRLLVRDTGIGIPTDKQELIFERFFQQDLPQHLVNQGSGIGLSISREFVRLHNGNISVESEPGRGSCFTVEIPLVPAGQESAAYSGGELKDARTGLTDENRLPSAGGLEVPGKKATLLLVEDNEDFLFYLKDNLREHYLILEAGNGREGWQKTLGQHPDLVVSDISMPDMNGIDLCRKIKQDRRTSHIPVILLTALTGQDQQLRGLETGANDYITKPFNFEILLSRIRNLLDEQARLRKAFQKQWEIRAPDPKLVSPEEEFLWNAMQVLEKNLSNGEFSVEDLSREMHMSRVALYKKLLALTGKTPLEFIRGFRLQRAAQLLKKSRKTVSEVAYEVGFNNPKYFARYFKSEYGILPSAYQQRHLGKGRSDNPDAASFSTGT